MCCTRPRLNRCPDLHEEVKFLIRAEVNHAPEVNLHYGDFVWANSNMADRTGGQLELTVCVSNVGAKGFEPSTG